MYHPKSGEPYPQHTSSLIASQYGIDPLKMGEGVERLRILLPRLAPQFVTHPFPDPILDHTPYELPLGPHI